MIHGGPSVCPTVDRLLTCAIFGQMPAHPVMDIENMFFRQTKLLYLSNITFSQTMPNIMPANHARAYIFTVLQTANIN